MKLPLEGKALFSPFDNRTLICSVDLLGYCKTRYPKRIVGSDPFIDYGTFYYWTRKGELRIWKTQSGIWKLGDEYPRILLMRRHGE